MTALAISIPEPLPFDHLLSFKGKCAVVTVCSRALGEAIVRRLAAAGAAVVSGAGGRARRRTQHDRQPARAVVHPV